MYKKQKNYIVSACRLYLPGCRVCRYPERSGLPSRNPVSRVIQLYNLRLGPATRVLLAVMKAKGVKRLICVTGFGAGDSRLSISCLQMVPFQIVFGRAYDDKSRQERLIKESGLDWTIVRPGVLTGGARSGRYKVFEEPSEWRNGIISRSDVAEFLVRQIEDRTYVHKAPVLVN